MIKMTEMTENRSAGWDDFGGRTLCDGQKVLVSMAELKQMAAM